ncbi:unnamed protein product, partial [marine sediment metagenome]
RSGNQACCDQVITVVDREPPDFDCPPDRTIFVDENCEGHIPDLCAEALATASDNCTLPENLVCTQVPPPCTVIRPENDCEQIVPVTVCLTDESGNETCCVVQVTFKDETPPDFDCPPDRTIPVDDETCEGVVPDLCLEVVADDNCTPPDELVCWQDPPAGTVVRPADDCEELVDVTVYVKDKCENTSSCVVQVTFKDDTDPKINPCPPDRIVPLDENCEGKIPDLCPEALAAATDNCTPQDELTCTQ